MASELRLECKFQMAEMEEQLRALKAKVEALEKLVGAGAAKPVAAAPPAVAEAPQPAPEPEIAEEVILAISAAVAAFLGKRARIRQVRLVSSMAWAQHGRASIQASHGIVVQR
jgi:methylmalonyl-CoA carboxyltransferase 12S subunit